MNNNTLLVAKWVSKVIPVIRYIILVMLAIIAVATIVLVFMQIGTTRKTVNPTAKVAMADIIVLAIETAASTGEVNL